MNAHHAKDFSLYLPSSCQSLACDYIETRIPGSFKSTSSGQHLFWENKPRAQVWTPGQANVAYFLMVHQEARKRAKTFQWHSLQCIH